MIDLAKNKDKVLIGDYIEENKFISYINELDIEQIFINDSK